MALLPFFLLMIAFIGVFLCNAFLSVTISPSGSLRGKRGDLVSVNCTFPDRAGSLSFVFDGVDSQALSAEMGRISIVAVTTNSSQLWVQTVGLGLTPVQTVQLNFYLAVYHDRSNLRCKFRTTEFSDFLNLTVLSSPCCNASSPVSINHNTTDQFLPLNCSEIISSRGNPPSSVQWSVISSSSGCTGNPTGDDNELYNINPIGRVCKGVTIECKANNDVGLTRKVFTLEVQSPPEIIGDCNARFIDSVKGTRFTWNKPNDDGGFPVKYEVTVHLNGVLNTTDLKNENDSSFAFTKGRRSDSLKFSVSAINALGSGPPCVDQLIIPFSSPASVNITNAMGTVKATTNKSFTLTFLSVQDTGRDDANVTKYIVYLNGNQRNFSAQPGNTQTFTITNLNDDTVYEIKVTAVNSFDRESRQSDPIQVRTLKTIEPLSDIEGESGGLNVGVIAGIVIAIVVPIVAVIILVVYFKSRSSTEEPSGGGEAPKDDKPTKKKPKKTPKDVKPKKPVDPDAVMYANLDLGKTGKAPAKEAGKLDHEGTSCDVEMKESRLYALSSTVKKKEEVTYEDVC